MADKKLIIADGHHRYETALNFRNEVLADPQAGRSLKQNANYVMMTFINMDSPGLVILPTHRVIYGLEQFSPDQFVRKAEAFYQVQPLDKTDDGTLLCRLAEAGRQTISFVACTKSGSYLLQAKAESYDRLPSEFSPRQRKLDVVHLHSLLLDRVLGISQEQVTNQQHVRYLRDAGEALQQVRSEPDVNAAFLMNPVSIEQVREIAFASEVLPQKSTDFYPKLLSGLTIYSLDDEHCARIVQNQSALAV
jgi:uncharacterized protein (DUF1015 family)